MQWYRIPICFIAYLIFQGVLYPVFAQSELELNYEQTAEYFIERVSNAQESSYQEVIDFYSDLLFKKRSVKLKIQQCTFIDKVFFNEDEYYNPKFEEFGACLDELKREYTKYPEASIYYLYNQYGDSSIVQIEELSDSLKKLDKELPNNIWMAYSKLANHYSGTDSRLAISYGLDAMRTNDKEDLSVLIAKHYLKVDEKIKAKEILSENIDTSSTSYNEYQKAELFEELECYKEAYEIYLRLNNEWNNKSEIGRVLKKIGRIKEARKYLIEASESEWNNRKSLEEIFLFDLEYSSGDSVLISYNEMRNEGFWADPFGIYKARMIIEKGAFGFKFRDVIPFFSFIILILICITIPYLLVVPVYSFGKWKQDQGAIPKIFDDRWDLKHFWYITSLFLLVSFLAEILFNYSDFISSWNDEFVEEKLDRLYLAKTVLFSDIFLIIGTFILFRKKDWNYFWYGESSIGKNIGFGIVFYFLLRIVYLINATIFDLNNTGSGMAASLIEEAILGLIDNYGIFSAFLTLVIIAPILEEIQFRGIMLGSASKYIPFWASNILQSLLFVAVHDNYSLSIFYFCFGMFTGYLRKKTGSYVAPITLHMINNLIAFFVILLRF
tara:strand:+ start:3201 stop:5030 length:1830 start_codon:yes stop_codon:yes gene_type:complete